MNILTIFYVKQAVCHLDHETNRRWRERTMAALLAVRSALRHISNGVVIQGGNCAVPRRLFLEERPSME
jgi:hypothetical protein